MHPQAAAQLQNSQLRDCIQLGVGFHHAALEPCDRAVVEELFREQACMVSGGPRLQGCGVYFLCVVCTAIG